MSVQREYWPLQWTVDVQAGQSPVTIFDLVELRSAVDTLRVAAGLPPIVWIGRTDEDATFAAGRTPIRAVHFTQLREAIGGLYRRAELDPIAEFSGGPIVAGARVIRLGDLLDLRGWVERYEQLRPDLAARVVRLFGTYTAPLPSGRHDRDGADPGDRLTEMWDGAGCSQYVYDVHGRLVSERRVLDSHGYGTNCEYDAAGRVAALTYPDGERIVYRYAPSGDVLAITSDWGSRLGGLAHAAPAADDAIAEAQARAGDGAVRRDALGRPVLLGNPARPALRLAYDGNGRLVKRLDERGTVHFAGEHYERNLGTGTGGAEAEQVIKYAPNWAGGRWLVRTPAEPALDALLARHERTRLDGAGRAAAETRAGTQPAVRPLVPSAPPASPVQPRWLGNLIDLSQFKRPR